MRQPNPEIGFHSFYCTSLGNEDFIKQATSLINVSRHYSANACLFPICALHHVAVTTVEGIGSTKTRLHPVQVTWRDVTMC